MYEIRPESIKTFINDRNVKLPRFQRKQTWDDKKNFQLCISLFKEYPIGVCILSVDEAKGKMIRWLLDGRQRKNALQLMYEDPENIYTWSKRFIGFKNSDQPSEIEEKFWTKIREYIEDELDEELTPENDDTEIIDGEDSPELITDGTFGLELLLEIIKIIHNQTKKTTGFTKPFDFGRYVKKLPYIENINGMEKLSSRRVKTFIDDFQKYCDEERLDEDEAMSLYKFMDNRFEIINDAKLKAEIVKQWPLIRERILIVEKIDNLLSTSKIGMIEVKNLSPSDSQKIFNIINSEGEKLTSVEILSAKPHWNIPIDNPSQMAVDAVKDLYRRIGTAQDTVVRWDMPATLVKRIGKNIIIKELSDTKTDFEKELTLGFKILSGLYDGGVKKENIERLGKRDLNWSIEIDQLINDIKNMLKLISSFSYFKFFNTWRTSLMEISSDAVSLDFLLIAYKDWERKGKPIGSDTNSKIFQKNCFILWDRLLYEYIFKLWRGSADQKTANNLSAFTNEPDKFEPIATEKWISVLKDHIFKESSIEGADVSKALMEPLLYHMYCMRCISGPDSAYDIEVDHIIPQSLFSASSISRSDAIQHNLLNLGLLPKNENVTKGNKRLIEITDPWLIEQIEKYEFIPQVKFSEYSNISNYIKMFNEREHIFLEAYKTSRENMLNN